MDFTRPKPVGADLACKDPQLMIGHGYDHNWSSNGTATDCRWRLA